MTPGEQLEKELSEKAGQSGSKATPQHEIMRKAIEAISGLPKNTLKKGQKLPGFTLPNAVNKKVNSADLLKKGPLVVTFYRGGWCPYCNIQLHAFQRVLPQIKGLGATLVAISPETPDNSLSTAKKNNLEFIVLSDYDNRYARKLGLVYELPNDLQDVYKKFGIDLPKNNGLNKWELPLSATYVVAQNGSVEFAFAEADYKKRANLDEILETLARLKKSAG
ncbi:MAG: AhpC/TSA family protein [Bdellovibrionaceae bacterium]|nr:AhpC/TSA family protein [Pseudobdellovibrionaceae bacterium]